jgi:hypothetical protein
MATFEDIIQEVLLNLEGYTGDQDIYGTINTEINATANTIEVNGSVFPDGSGFTAGMIEVGEELVYAQEFDRTTATFTGCLRGWRGTTAATHPVGTLVRNNPRYPRNSVKRAINDAIANLHPTIPVYKTYEFQYKGGQARYDLPAGAIAVTRVRYSEPGATKTWAPVKRWTFIPAADTTSETGAAIDIYDALNGRTVQVLYEATPAALVNLGDTLETTAGVYSWARDIVIYGACYRLASFIDSPRAIANSADQQVISNSQTGVPYNSGQNLSRYFLGLYNARLQEAQNRLQDLYPAQRHFVR